MTRTEYASHHAKHLPVTLAGTARIGDELTSRVMLAHQPRRESNRTVPARHGMAPTPQSTRSRTQGYALLATAAAPGATGPSDFYL